MEKLTVICPCCEATLSVDANTGALLAAEEKTKAHSSFEDLKDELEKQKNLREQLFAQESQAQKDRSRILEEKFQAAKKRAEAGGELEKPFKNPLDFD
ncbi:MAG: 2-nitropropane dioxygenase [Acidobacteria bacterium]|jgi:uncharacterized Zn finger protein (UPF0148 family)|nr:2-nitropropane dioxygenase [Acidobacteriota bacterium]